MRLMSRLAENVDFAFDLVWGFIGVGIIALAVGIVAYGYNDDPTVVASNTVPLAPINVEGVVR
jgi:hypothetical protein